MEAREFGAVVIDVSGGLGEPGRQALDYGPWGDSELPQPALTALNPGEAQDPRGGGGGPVLGSDSACNRRDLQCSDGPRPPSAFEATRVHFFQPASERGPQGIEAHMRARVGMFEVECRFSNFASRF